MRGMLNSKVQDIAEKYLGRPLKSTTELRLLPYLDFVMKNDQKLDPNKINSEERQLLSELRTEGHIEGGVSGLQMTKEFYMAVQEIIWQAYVVQGAIYHDENDKVQAGL